MKEEPTTAATPDRLLTVRFPLVDTRGLQAQSRCVTRAAGVPAPPPSPPLAATERRADRLWLVGQSLSIAALVLWIGTLLAMIGHYHALFEPIWAGMSLLVLAAVACGLAATALYARARRAAAALARQRLQERHREEVRARYALWN